MKSVITCDLEGVIETINPDGEKLFGYKKDELVGKKRVSLFSAGEIVIQNVGMWLSQANKPFGTPASMLAHGFLAGVVHSWNSRREEKFPKLCFDAPADQMQIRNLMKIVKEYIGDRDQDLKVPAQGVIRVAMMGRFPCRE